MSLLVKPILPNFSVPGETATDEEQELRRQAREGLAGRPGTAREQHSQGTVRSWFLLSPGLAEPVWALAASSGDISTSRSTTARSAGLNWSSAFSGGNNNREQRKSSVGEMRTKTNSKNVHGC